MIPFSEITEQKISEKYNSLSQDLKNVLSSANTSVIIENIAAKYRLGEEKTEMLIQLVGLVILGFATFEDMKIEMKEAIEIDPQFIPLITDEIRQKIFGSIMNLLPKAPVRPTMPLAAAPIPATTPQPATLPAPSADRYREPATPEVVDLRKAPSPVIIPRPPAPIAPKVILPPKPIVPPAASKVEPPSLIEAEPHKAPATIPVPVPTPLSRMPQVILRSPGLPPTDLPHDILDLRKDKGEF